MDHLPIVALLGFVEKETAEAGVIPGMMIPENKGYLDALHYRKKPQICPPYLYSFTIRKCTYNVYIKWN